MALTVKDLHVFLENNLPQYQRRDLVAVCKFYLLTRTKDDRKPLKRTIDRIQDFKKFICLDWQGVEINNSKRPKQNKPEPVYGACTCGGIFVKRTNRSDGGEFLGCSNFPTCRKTKQL
jgi:hypothetical protein